MNEGLPESKQLANFRHLVAEGKDLLMEGLWDSPKALLIAEYLRATGRSVLLIAGAAQEESRLIDDLAYFDVPAVFDYPAWETLPNEEMPPSPDVVGERYAVLRALQSQSDPVVVVSRLQACLQRVIDPQQLESLNLELSKGQHFRFDDLIDRLLRMGYQRGDVAADKGEFAVRGGMIDVFPVGAADPVRLDFWGDEIDAIRAYDPVAQTSVGDRPSIVITPAVERELLTTPAALYSLLDYIGPDCCLVFDDLLAIEENLDTLGQSGDIYGPSFMRLGEFLEEAGPRQRLYFATQAIDDLSPTTRQGNSLSFECFGQSLQAQRWRSPFLTVTQHVLPGLPYEARGEELLQGLGQVPVQGSQLRLLCQSESEEEHLAQRFVELGVQLPANTQYTRGYLSTGFVLGDADFVLLPMAEITGYSKVHRQKQRSAYHSVPSELYELSEGDMVVHTHHGVGQFHGVHKQPNASGVLTEYFLLEYAGESKLYVPLTQSHLVSKYVGSGEERPVLHALGSGRWKKAKAKTEKAIMGYASDLLRLYAERAAREGYSCPSDGPEIQRFELDFPYIESEDQLAAIADVKADLCEGKVMERLVCGDVGYGKTEVAMRAALKTVIDGCKQVAVLVPTTVLAMQHYDTFCERMANFPVTISVLSRFRSTKQTRETLEGLRRGSVDILIGTHRIISKDVAFKDLGLIVIDEEQRFGVKAKEKLKEIRQNVDCLTLSATPIPRTLYMSLVGARDLSVIATPPDDRLPIQTMITEDSDQTIKSALLRELARDGQAFLVHNRVQSIHAYAQRIQKLVPHARIVIGHGQMSAQELDTVFHTFRNGEADILIATTIIENGVDIPNANTILVDRADRFGLAELYQLRGRVGRWKRRAYAYFLVPKSRELSEIATKRLQALVEANGRGGGMRIAMRDLEIRGAGDILGMEQSGHVSSIGFHLYCKLLKRTVETLRGELPSTITDTKLEFGYDARLPEDYVNASALRMEVYQRLGEASSWTEVDAIYRELEDRFGKPPGPVVWLYHLTRIRVFCSLNSFTQVRIDKVSLQAERKKGADLIQKKVLIGKARSPAALEKKVIQALKKDW